MAGAIDFVVFVEKNPLLGGRRCVTQVLEVAGMQGEQVGRNELFLPSPSDGRAVRNPEVALTPTRARRFTAALARESVEGSRHAEGWAEQRSPQPGGW
jgi:hypothetical protein